MKPSKRKSDAKGFTWMMGREQREKFGQVAHQLATDQSEPHFGAVVKRVAKPRDEAASRAGKGAVVRPTKLLKQAKPKKR
jgi:hypothetical protein